MLVKSWGCFNYDRTRIVSNVKSWPQNAEVIKYHWARNPAQIELAWISHYTQWKEVGSLRWLVFRRPMLCLQTTVGSLASDRAKRHFSWPKRSNFQNFDSQTSRSKTWYETFLQIDEFLIFWVFLFIKNRKVFVPSKLIWQSDIFCIRLVSVPILGMASIGWRSLWHNFHAKDTSVMKEWSTLLLLHCILYVTKVGLVSSACHMHRACCFLMSLFFFFFFWWLWLWLLWSLYQFWNFQRWHWAPSKVQPKMIQSAGGVQVLLQMGGEVLERGWHLRLQRKCNLGTITSLNGT